MRFDPDALLDRAEAVERVLELRSGALDGRPAEAVPLEAVAGRTLAEAVVAEADAPPYDYATMDGFAFDASESFPLDVVDLEVYPEDDPPALGRGEAVRIATGAPLPGRANAVLRREDATLEDGRLTGEAVSPGTYTYGRGSNVRAGERLFEAGEVLSPKDAILLGDLGYETVSVHTRFEAALLATGTEIHEGRSADLDSAMLAGLLRSWGARATYAGSVPDDPDRVEARIAELADGHDVVITTGGTSVGRKDYVLQALAALGTVHFHGVALRPGKPIAVATLADRGATAIAIPGKPIGAHTVATLVARAFFRGADPLPTVGATLARSVGIEDPAFEYAVPVSLDGDGAFPLGHVDSALSIYEGAFDASVLSSSTRASRADGFVLTRAPLDAGETVEVVPYTAIE